MKEAKWYSDLKERIKYTPTYLETKFTFDLAIAMAKLLKSKDEPKPGEIYTKKGMRKVLGISKRKFHKILAGDADLKVSEIAKILSKLKIDLKYIFKHREGKDAVQR